MGGVAWAIGAGLWGRGLREVGGTWGMGIRTGTRIGTGSGDREWGQGAEIGTGLRTGDVESRASSLCHSLKGQREWGQGWGQGQGGRDGDRVRDRGATFLWERGEQDGDGERSKNRNRCGDGNGDRS